MKVLKFFGSAVIAAIVLLIAAVMLKGNEPEEARRIRECKTSALESRGSYAVIMAKCEALEQEWREELLEHYSTDERAAIEAKAKATK